MAKSARLTLIKNKSLSRLLTPLCAIMLPALLATADSLHAQAFTGAFTFGSGGNVDSFAYNGTAIPGISVSPLTKNGVTTSSSSGNSRATGWPTGATNGSDVFTGSLDPTKYFEFTFTAAPGKVINLPGLTFGIGRSGTGPRQWQWRSSVDGFAAPIPVGVLNASVAQDGGAITVPDSNSNWTGNEITTSGAAYENLSSVTFRVYVYNAEASSGTGGLAGPLTFSGTLADGGGVTTPTIFPAGTFTSFTTFLGTPSASQSATVSGFNLTESILVAAPAGFEVSLDNSVFGPSVSLAQTSGEASGTVYARLAAIAPEGAVSGNLVLSSAGATTESLGVAGTVQLPASLTAAGYTQDFTGFTSAASLPAGWSLQAADQTYSAWETTTTGAKFNSETVNVFGYQQTGTTGVVQQVLTLRNDTSETITDMTVSYTGLVGRADQGRSPFYTVSVGGNVVLGLAFSTVNGVNSTVETAVSGLSVAPGQTFQISWSSDGSEAGSPGSGSRRQVGIGSVSLTVGAPALASPEFDVPAGTYFANQTVRVSNFSSYVAGTQVRFTTDGTAPGPESDLYNDATGITLVDGNGTVNLRAVAIDPATEETSLVTSAIYQFPLNVANLTALRASPTGSTIYRVTGQVTFTAGTSNRNTKFFQDNAAGIQIDDTAGTITSVYTAGDNVAGIIGRISTFNGQLQMVPLQDFGAPVSSGNAVTPIPRSIATLDNDVQSMLVVLQDVTFENAGQTFGGGGSTTPIADASTSGAFVNAFRNIFGDSNVNGATIPSGPNTLTGIVQRTSATVIAVGPRSMSDIVFDGTPSLSLQSNKVQLTAGATGETEEATVEIRRAGATDADLVVDLTQDVDGAFAADIDGSLNYLPLPTAVTIPAGSSAVTIYVVALDRSVSINATLTASAEGFEPATQLFAITGSGGGGETFEAGPMGHPWIKPTCSSMRSGEPAVRRRPMGWHLSPASRPPISRSQPSSGPTIRA